MSRKHFCVRRQAGFSLVEMGVALVALGLLVLAFVAYWRLSAQEKVVLVERDLLQITERSVVGFVHSHFRLPCPASTADGNEDCTAGRQIGQLPWRTLGIADGRAGQLRYGVYRAANTAQPWLDMDLTVPKDRLRPSFTIGLPPVLPTAPLALNPANANLLDFCYATTLASTAAADASALGVSTPIPLRPAVRWLSSWRRRVCWMRTATAALSTGDRPPRPRPPPRSTLPTARWTPYTTTG